MRENLRKLVKHYIKYPIEVKKIIESSLPERKFLFQALKKEEFSKLKKTFKPENPVNLKSCSWYDEQCRKNHFKALKNVETTSNLIESIFL